MDAFWGGTQKKRLCYPCPLWSSTYILVCSCDWLTRTTGCGRVPAACSFVPLLFCSSHAKGNFLFVTCCGGVVMLVMLVLQSASKRRRSFGRHEKPHNALFSSWNRSDTHGTRRRTFCLPRSSSLRLPSSCNLENKKNKISRKSSDSKSIVPSLSPVSGVGR